MLFMHHMKHAVPLFCFLEDRSHVEWEQLPRLLLKDMFITSALLWTLGFDPVLTIRSVHCPSLSTTWHAQQAFRHLKCSALSKCWTHFMHDEPWKLCYSGVLPFRTFPVGHENMSNEWRELTSLRWISNIPQGVGGGGVRLYATGSKCL